MELGVLAVGLGYYWHRSRRDGSFGARAASVAAVVLILHIVNW